ncbi:MAG: hypothetical protein R2941_15295 [Desulfobacterales bacterium]
MYSKNRIFPKNPVFLKNFMPEQLMFQINGELVSDTPLPDSFQEIALNLNRVPAFNPRVTQSFFVKQLFEKIPV